MATRKKTVYKVAELPHVFMNGAAMHGQRAGTDAHTENGVLYRTDNDPAAAMISDATARNGKPVVAVFRQREKSQWTVAAIEAAVPPEKLDYVTLAVVPDFDRSPAVVRSAEAMCAIYLRAMERACLETSNDPYDRDGHNLNYGAYAILRGAYTALLRLTWTNQAAQERARAALAAHDREWMILPDGTFNNTLVATISQRKRAVQVAAVAREKLSEFVREWENLTGHKARMSVAMSYDDRITRELPRLLTNAISGVDDKTIAACYEARTLSQRAIAFEERKRAYRRGCALVTRAYKSDEAGVQDPAVVASAPWMAARLAEAAAFARNRARRERAVNALREVYEKYDTFVQLEKSLPQLIGIAKTATCAADLAPIGDIGTRQQTFASAAEYAIRVRDAATRKHGMPMPAYEDAERLAAITEQYDTLYAILRDKRAAFKHQIEVEQADGELTHLETVLSARPRMVYRRLGDNVVCFRWQLRDVPDSALTALRERHARLREAALERINHVTEFDEWCNGGEKPSPFDWLRIAGNRAVTSRNTEVPLRAAIRALEYIDAQPPGEFKCSFGIGAFTLTGRDSTGHVRVGCHTFSPAAVEAFRRQLAARTGVVEEECETA